MFFIRTCVSPFLCNILPNTEANLKHTDMWHTYLMVLEFKRGLVILDVTF